MQDRSSGCRHCRRPSRKGAPYRSRRSSISPRAIALVAKSNTKAARPRPGKSNGIRSKDRLASTGRRDPAVARGERKRHDAGFADGFHRPEGGKMEAVVDCHRGESDLAGLSRSERLPRWMPGARTRIWHRRGRSPARGPRPRAPHGVNLPLLHGPDASEQTVDAVRVALVALRRMDHVRDGLPHDPATIRRPGEPRC